jgi:hypothetical protein
MAPRDRRQRRRRAAVMAGAAYAAGEHHGAQPRGTWAEAVRASRRGFAALRESAARACAPRREHFLPSG